MTDAFTQAVTTMFEDPNLSFASTYTPSGGSAQSVRLIRTNPSATPLSLTAESFDDGDLFKLRQSEVSTQPEEGATIIDRAGNSRVVESAKPDPRNLVWLLDVRGV